MFDIVDLKTAIYRNRFEAELGDGTPFDVVKHDLEKVRDELFGLPFELAGRELVHKFKRNFTKLRDFMERVDKDIAQLTVFSGPKGGELGADEDDDDYGNENDDGNKPKKGNRKFKGVNSVSQLKHLLRNYDALVEGQHSLLNSSIAKMAMVPSPDDISDTFNRF